MRTDNEVSEADKANTKPDSTGHYAIPVATCQVGQCFGERALQSDEPRAASVKALSRTELISITQHAYRRTLAVVANHLEEGEHNAPGSIKNFCRTVLSKKRSLRTEDELKQLASFLDQRIAFFKKFPVSVQVEVCRVCELVSIAGGQTLFCQGTVGEAYYIILSGTAGRLRVLLL
jgi:CRP-like cAMP-binding protein